MPLLLADDFEELEIDNKLPFFIHVPRGSPHNPIVTIKEWQAWQLPIFLKKARGSHFSAKKA